MKIHNVMLSALALLAVAGAASAQPATPPKYPACNGTLVTLRVSTIKTTKAAFADAAKDHLAWYRSHGFNDNRNVVAIVYEYDQATNSFVESTKEVATLHVNPPPLPETMAKRDAAWDAYVKEYRDSSDIATEKMICVPVGAAIK